MNQETPTFRRPSALERIFNKAFGVVVGLGLGLGHNYLVQVQGRRTGRVHSTPVNVLELDGRRLLVAPRGRTEWVRNAEAAGAVTLKRGRNRRRYRLRAVPPAERPVILSAYLERFRLTVQRYFPVPAGSGPAAFAEIADRYPVFELRAEE
ncbi:MAG: nitroreductase/quinone reductase family protein [Candidatus Rokuibacteriota bacterium]